MTLLGSRLLLVLSLTACQPAPKQRPIPADAPWITPLELGIIVNTADPQSLEIGRYYQKQRQIPAQNIFLVTFPPKGDDLSPQVFQQLWSDLQRRMPANIQGLALTWVTPYRVGCMSVTSAFAFGFDPSYCADTCRATKPSPYFNTELHKPYKHLKIRPTMAIAARDFGQAKALIDRGIAADDSNPLGTAYLMSTSDRDRNVRASFYTSIVAKLATRFNIRLLQADVLENQTDVMFYFTGLARVEKIRSNRYLPGAVADHLTSYGGVLTGDGQMSSLRWLEAGATGSYGTVVEPCNFPQKFTHPGVMMYHYLRGDTLLEAYWKSVAWPGQGIFVGEPLSRPFSN